MMAKLRVRGVDVTGRILDHIAYTTSTATEYERIKKEWGRHGKFVHEAIVDGRRVGIMKLVKPLQFRKFQIDVLEVIEPKKDQLMTSGCEHGEFVIEEGFAKFVKKYPDLDWDRKSMDNEKFPNLKLRLSERLVVKFHPKGILEMIG